LIGTSTIFQVVHIGRNLFAFFVQHGAEVRLVLKLFQSDSLPTAALVMLSSLLEASEILVLFWLSDDICLVLLLTTAPTVVFLETKKSTPTFAL
jgi:hypothetical protein